MLTMFLYRCPNTGYRVQGIVVEEDKSPSPIKWHRGDQ
jgi:hypothetical protein